MAKLAEGARILNSTLMENTTIIDRHSCVSRCTAGKYIAVGCFTLVSRTDIGNYVTIASRCSIGAFNHPTDWLSVCEFQYRDTSYMFSGETICAQGLIGIPTAHTRTTIGSDVWIGDNAVVLQGVTVGDGAIIGAGSVVTKDVDSFSIVVGNPGRHLRYRFTEEIRDELLLLEWWNLDLSKLNGINFADINEAIVDLKRIMSDDK